MGLHLLPHKRQVKIPYRSIMLEGVLLTSGVVDLVTFSLWSKIKAAGVATGKVQELEAEKLLGCASSQMDEGLLVDSSVFLQVPS